MNKSTFFIGIAITAVLVILFLYAPFSPSLLHSARVTPTSASSSTFSQSPIFAAPLAASPRATTTPVSDKVKITLSVGENDFPVDVPLGATVLTAMDLLSAQGILSYTGRQYPGLGEFIESINGKRNGDGRYWILYINGELATKGVSALALSAGDRVAWKYEKSY